MQAIKPGQGTSEADTLAEELRGQTAQEVLAGLEARLSEAERTGAAVDPDVLELYYDILDEKDPVEDDGVAFEKTWETFKHHHSELFTAAPAERAPCLRRVKHWTRRRRLAVAVIALLALLVGATVAYRVGSLVTDKGETVVSKNAGGVMLMTEANAEGYRSLDDALEAQGISDIGISPTWIPKEYALESVNVIEIEETVKITAIFVSNDNQKIMYRLVRDDAGVATVEYEKNVAYRETWNFDGNEYYFMDNNEDLRVLWNVGGSYCNIFGDATEEQLKEMVKSIKTR